IVTLTGTDCPFPLHFFPATNLPDGFQGVDGDLEFLLDALPPSCTRHWNSDSKPVHVGNIGTPASGREHAIVKRYVSINAAGKEPPHPQQVGLHDGTIAVGSLHAVTELLREND